MLIITYESNTYAAWNAGDQMIIINVSVLNNCWREGAADPGPSYLPEGPERGL
jgi:hypothetical protein